jgi:hypothetical protein
MLGDTEATAIGTFSSGGLERNLIQARVSKIWLFFAFFELFKLLIES